MLNQRIGTSLLSSVWFAGLTACSPAPDADPEADSTGGAVMSDVGADAATDASGASPATGANDTGANDTGANDTDPDDTHANDTDPDDTDAGSTTSGNGAETSASDGAASTEAGANAAPVILSATVTPSSLEGAGTVLLVVIATDPDGIGDLIGGSVETPGGASYGILSAEADEGAYTLSIDWTDFHAMMPIDIDPGGVQSREVVVVLFDQGGASVEHTLSVDLRPAAAGLAVCDGDSVSLQSDEHCSECDFSCSDDLGSSLSPWACFDGIACEKLGMVVVNDPTTTCNQACGAAAGPQADVYGVDGCQLVNAIVCPDPIAAPSCGAMSLTQLPPPPCAADDSTFLRCFCWALYDPSAP